MSTDDRTFEQVLSDQTLSSERLRLLLVASVAAAAFIVLGGLDLAAPRVISAIFHERSFIGWAAVTAAVFILVELTIRWIIGRRQRTGRSVPRVAQYLNAFVEITLPSVILYSVSGIFGAAYTMATPPVFLYSVFIVLSALRLNAALCFFTGALAGIEYIALAFALPALHPSPGVDPVLSSQWAHGAKALIFVGMGALAGVVTVQIRRGIVSSYETMVERNRVVGVFGRHVSPAVAEALLQSDRELGGRKQTVCLMFLDIRNFTARSERRDPIEVVSFLNELFDFMVDAVNSRGGIINKFLGDGFMAVFGAPIADDLMCAHAVESARAILEGVARFNAAGDGQAVQVGIGLHAGEAVTGNVGSVERREYTIIGDVVNVASRIEQLNKTYGSALLVSDAVARALGTESGTLKRIGPVTVKGHEEPIVIFQIE